MKLLIASLVTVIAMMCFGATAASLQAPREEAREASVIDLSKPMEVVPLWEKTNWAKQYAQSLPDCLTIHGTACVSPTAPVYCWWSQAGEQTICRCISNTRVCTGL